jgi:hypothetical protein
VYFDGYGKGVFAGGRETGEGMGLEEYYGLLKKKKVEFLSGIGN